MNISWLKAAGVRALKTVCQTAVALIGTAVVLSEVDWWMVISASILAGILSILTSLAGIPETDYDTDLVGGEGDFDTDEEQEENDPGSDETDTGEDGE